MTDLHPLNSNFIFSGFFDSIDRTACFNASHLSQKYTRKELGLRNINHNSVSTQAHYEQQKNDIVN